MDPLPPAEVCPPNPPPYTVIEPKTELTPLFPFDAEPETDAPPAPAVTEREAPEVTENDEL